MQTTLGQRTELMEIAARLEELSRSNGAKVTATAAILTDWVEGAHSNHDRDARMIAVQQQAKEIGKNGQNVEEFLEHVKARAGFLQASAQSMGRPRA